MSLSSEKLHRSISTRFITVSSPIAPLSPSTSEPAETTAFIEATATYFSENITSPTGITVFTTESPKEITEWNLTLAIPEVTTERPEMATSSITTPIIVVEVTIPDITNITTAAFLPEDTVATIATPTKSYATISITEQVVPITEVEYGETEAVYDDEYADDYKKAYEDYEEKSTEIFVPSWRDYVEENFTTKSVVGTTRATIELQVTVTLPNETALVYTTEKAFTTASLSPPVEDTTWVPTTKIRNITSATEALETSSLNIISETETETMEKEIFNFTTEFYTLGSIHS